MIVWKFKELVIFSRKKNVLNLVVTQLQITHTQYWSRLDNNQSSISVFPMFNTPMHLNYIPLHTRYLVCCLLVDLGSPSIGRLTTDQDFCKFLFSFHWFGGVHQWFHELYSWTSIIKEADLLSQWLKNDDEIFGITVHDCFLTKYYYCWYSCQHWGCRMEADAMFCLTDKSPSCPACWLPLIYW